MITKSELKKQIEEICGEPVDGQNIGQLLKDIDSPETPVYWGNIPEDILSETF